MDRNGKVIRFLPQDLEDVKASRKALGGRWLRGRLVRKWTHRRTQVGRRVRRSAVKSTLAWRGPLDPTGERPHGKAAHQ